LSFTHWPVDPFATSTGPKEGPIATQVDRRPAGGGSGSPRGDLNTLARGGMLSLVGSVASSVLGFALVVVITRGLHGSGAGVLFEAIALFTILSNTVELGADTALVRTVARYRALGRRQDVKQAIGIALWPVLIFGGAVAVAMFVFAPQLADIFIKKAPPAEAVRYIRLFAPFLPLAGATTVALSGTRGFGSMVPYVAVQNIGVPLARPILVPLAIMSGLGAVAVALAWVLPVALGFVVAIGALLYLQRRSLRRHRRQSQADGGRRGTRDLAAEFWRFAAPRGLAGILMIAVIWGNILLVGALRSAREAGVFAAASRLVGVGTFALQAVGLAIAPQISGLFAQKEKARAEAVFQTATWWLMVVSWPMYIVMAVFAPFLMRIFGKGYASGGTALMILSLALLALVGTGNNKIVMLMGGGSGWNLGITIVSLASNIGLNLWLIPRYGINGAAIAFAASILEDNIATTAVVYFKMRLQPFGRGYLVVVLGSLICYGALGVAVRLTFGMSLATLFGFGVVASVLYLGLMWRFRRILRFNVLREAIRGRSLGARGAGSGSA
jgi:O-antigen/teichoic acid export membrane protein